MAGECGCARDAFLAARAFTRLIFQGLTQGEPESAAHAATMMGFCYRRGPCSLDPVEAHAWFTVALAFGVDDRVQIPVIRSKLAKTMTPDELARTGKRADEIFAPFASLLKTKEREEAPPAQSPVSYGTAFFVSPDGHAVTNQHVVDGCRTIAVGGAKATVVVADDGSDLAILSTSTARKEFAVFRDVGNVNAGESVVVFGYPLTVVLGSPDPTVTTGIVSSLTGPSADRRLMQVTAPMQPGNSGGPVLDSSGRIIGVAVSTMSTVKLANYTGAIPQNVNYAIKAPAVRALLESYEVPFQTAKTSETLDVPSIAARARSYTAQVECTR